MATKITFELTRAGQEAITLVLSKSANLWTDPGTSGCLLAVTGPIEDTGDALICKASSTDHVVLSGAKWNGCPPEGDATLSDSSCPPSWKWEKVSES